MLFQVAVILKNKLAIVRGRLLWALLAPAILLPFPALAQKMSQKPIGILFDTDMYGDIDDMLALAMLHALQDRNEIRILAVTIGTDAPWVARYINLVNAFYGHADIPLGMVRGGITPLRLNQPPFDRLPSPYSPNGINYTQYIAQLRDRKGDLVYPQKVRSGPTEDAVRVLRRTLTAQADHSVVMIQVGYSTNFAQLLRSGPDSASRLSGKMLISRKVRFLSAMAGSFADVVWEGRKIPAGGPEFNLAMDVPSAQAVFAEWPTPIVASGFEVGLRLPFPEQAFEQRFNYVDHHPIADTYRYVGPAYRRTLPNPGAPHDHPTFDLTSVLYAARPDAGYFALSNPGTITVLNDGGSRFTSTAGGLHRFLVLSDDQKARTLEAMVMLVSQPARGMRAQPKMPMSR